MREYDETGYASENIVPIVRAAGRGQIDEVMRLIEAGADVNRGSHFRDTAFYWAVLTNHLNMCNLLIDFGADINLPDGEPIINAVYYGFEEIVDLLLKNNVNLDTFLLRTPYPNALYTSIAKKNLIITKKLLDAGIDMVSDYAFMLEPTRRVDYYHLPYIFAKFGRIDIDYYGEHKEDKKILDLIINKEIENLEENEKEFIKNCIDGEVKGVEEYISKKSNLNITSLSGFTPLIWAVLNKQDLIVEKLLKANVNMDVFDKGGNNALLWACRMGLEEIAINLIDSGCDVNVVTYSWQKTPLIWAIEFGHKKIIDKLLEKKLNLDVVDNEGRTALIRVSSMKDFDLGIKLVKLGANLNHISEERGESALTFAASSKNLDFVKILIDNGADTHKRRDNGKDPLIFAIYSKDDEIANYLIDNGSYIDNIWDLNSFTPFLLALSRNNRELAFKLLDLGANIDAVNFRGENALSLTLNNYEYDKSDLPFLLIDKGININNQNFRGETPLIISCENGYLELVEKLLDHGANIGLYDKKNKSALDYAKENEEIKNLLINSLSENVNDNLFFIVKNNLHNLLATVKLEEIDINQINSDKDTALVVACKNESLECAKLLINLGADCYAVERGRGLNSLQIAIYKRNMDLINLFIKDKELINKPEGLNGYTPLSIASQSGAVEIIKLLVENGADLNGYDSLNGYTPLQWAVIEWQEDSVEALINLGADKNYPSRDGKAKAYHLIGGVEDEESKEKIEKLLY